MNAREHAVRIRHNLDEVRQELTAAVQPISDASLDWTPVEGMKSYRSLLVEIGAMESVCVHYAKTGTDSDWEAATRRVGMSGTSASALLSDLAAIRSETLEYLAGVTEEKFETPVALQGMWQQYFGAVEVEPEEILRWVVRHEYYHLGQIIIYRWQQGNNPYKAA